MLEFFFLMPDFIINKIFTYKHHKLGFTCPFIALDSDQLIRRHGHLYINAKKNLFTPLRVRGVDLSPGSSCPELLSQIQEVSCVSLQFGSSLPR